MNQTEYFVSVIIPVYNGAKFLLQTITHVLAQNYYPLEIIVVDDGSTDDTAEIAAQLKDKIRYFYQDNNGPASARNLGIKEAKGNIIAFLDVDDLWSDNKLELQLNYLANHPEVDIVQGMIVRQTIADNNEIIETSPPYNFINLGCAIYRQSTFKDVGFFDETMRFGEDVDWLMRAWEKRIRKSVIDEVTYYYRMHQENMTKGKSLVELGLVRIYKKHMDRLRSGKLVLEPLPPNFPSSNEYIGGEPTIHLKNPRFTIISNNTWGNAVYKRLNYLYQTPFVGTYIPDKYYFKLLKNLRYYLESDLTFIPKAKNNQERTPLIGLLDREIEIQFHQENNQAEAQNNWQKRLKKIQWDNIFISYCCDRHIPKAKQLQYLKEFEQLDFPVKVAFTPTPYPQLSSTIYLANYGENESSIFKESAKTLDIIAWLNQSRGNDTQAYKI